MTARGALRVVAGAGRVAAALALGLAGAPAASAHQDGRVQLFVSRLEVRPAGAGTWSMRVTLIDSDSGEPAAGFDVRAAVLDGKGSPAEPLTLAEDGGGTYAATVAASTGQWEVSVRARALPGGEPAVPLERTWALGVGPDGALSTHRPTPAPGGGAAPATLGLVAAAAVGGAVFLARSRRRPPPEAAGR